MTKIYFIASISYRLVFGILIPLSLYAIAMVSSAGHDPHMGEACLTLLFIATTISLLTIYQNSDKENNAGRKAFRYTLIGLVLVSLFYECYSLYDTWIICGCFTKEDNIESFIIFIFGLITSTVLAGLIKNKL
ncbi:MAG: hypothetical protein ABI402_10020 [Ferruginibacter sp.]